MQREECLEKKERGGGGKEREGGRKERGWRGGVRWGGGGDRERGGENEKERGWGKREGERKYPKSLGSNRIFGRHLPLIPFRTHSE